MIESFLNATIGSTREARAAGWLLGLYRGETLIDIDGAEYGAEAIEPSQQRVGER